MRFFSALVAVFALAALVLVPWSDVAYAGNPCPFHTIEGTSGGAITPMACMVGSERDGSFFWKPAVAMSYVNLSDKYLAALTITERLGEHLEWGYGGDQLGLGSLPADIRDATGTNIGLSSVWLHNFNLRMKLVEENDCFGGIAMPAVTAGVDFKVNQGIRQINQRLGGVLNTIGYERENGVDFTVTATKTFLPKQTGLAGPLLLTAGVRASEGAQLGFLGFGDTYYATFEGSVCYFLRDWLLVGYEFRQKPDPYDQIPGLIGQEDHWHAVDVALILDDHSTLCVGYGNFGTLANTEANSSWFFQLKRNF